MAQIERARGGLMSQDLWLIVPFLLGPIVSKLLVRSCCEDESCSADRAFAWACVDTVVLAIGCTAYQLYPIHGSLPIEVFVTLACNVGVVYAGFGAGCVGEILVYLASDLIDDIHRDDP
ncbi:MAG TPA: hypothetical protein VI483_02295 [Candidatus Paceibacterota bacterium]